MLGVMKYERRISKFGLSTQLSRNFLQLNRNLTMRGERDSRLYTSKSGSGGVEGVAQLRSNTNGTGSQRSAGESDVILPCLKSEARRAESSQTTALTASRRPCTIGNCGSGGGSMDTGNRSMSVYGTSTCSSFGMRLRL